LERMWCVENGFNMPIADGLRRGGAR
jgi:hypothetical protein